MINSARLLPRRFLASATALAMCLQAGSLYAVETIWRYLTPIPPSGNSAAQWLDLDADGTREIVISGAPWDGVTSVLKATSDGITIVDVHQGQSRRGDFVPLSGKEGAADRIIVGRDDDSAWKILELAGIPLQVVHELTFDFPVTPRAYGDIDGDGQPEILTYHYNADESVVRLIDYQTGEVKWSHQPVDAMSSAVAVQLDDDGPMEVILAGGSPGRILNGADGSVEWSYAPGFGWEVHVGRFQTDDQIRTFATRGTGTTVFRTQPYSPLYDLPIAGVGTGGYGAVLDVNGDGRDDLILASTMQAHGLRAHDMMTGGSLASWPSSFVIASVPAVGRFQAGSDLLMVHGAGIPSYMNPAGIEVKAFPDGDVLYHEIPNERPHNRLASADVDGDGNEEIILAMSRAPGSSGLAPTVEIAVFEGGTEPAYSRHLSGIYWDLNFQGALMAIADFDGTGNPDVVLTTRHSRIVSLDGATLETRWERYRPQSDLADLSPVAVSSADFDGDGVQDVVLLMEHTYGYRLVALSGIDGQTLWISPDSISGLVTGSSSLLVAQVDDDPAEEVVVTIGQQLRVFDALSRELEWTQSFAGLSAESAVLVQSSPECRLGLVGSETMRIFDCATRTVVDSVSLPVGTSRVDAVDPQGDALLIAAAGRLFALKRAAGGYFQVPLTPGIGIELAAVRGRMFPAAREGVVDVLAGTNAYPARIRVDIADYILRTGFQHRE